MAPLTSRASPLFTALLGCVKWPLPTKLLQIIHSGIVLSIFFSLPYYKINCANYYQQPENAAIVTTALTSCGKRYRQHIYHCFMVDK
jgi:hypothetical protein